jgi:ferritin-like metal-binding protein YciE
MSEFRTTNDTIRYDSAADVAGGENERHSIQTYVSDMLALERHIAQPLERQLKLGDTAKYGSALATIAQIKAFNDAHVAALDQALQQVGGHPASSVKSAWSDLLGAAAGAIDSVRKTKVSKSLRDDYTALSLASISYEMLYATAVGLGNAAIAAIAQRHLADYARVIMQINQVIPEIVLRELQDDGENVQATAAETIRQQLNEIWQSQSSVAHQPKV